MFESFACKDEWAHFSNEAVELLYTSWNSLADNQNTVAMNKIKVFLQTKYLLDEEGAGCRSIGLYGKYLAEEIATRDQLEALAFLIRKTGDDPTIISNIKWDDELIESWRIRLKIMFESVEESASLV